MTADEVSITLDMAWDDADPKLDREACAQLTALGIETVFDVKVKILRFVGPAGGWPEVKLSGPRANVERALITAWGCQPDEVEEFLRLQ